MYHQAVSELPVEELPEKLCLGTNEFSEYPSKRILNLVHDYAHVPLFVNYMLFPCTLRFKHSSHFSSIDVTPSILRRWRIVCAVCGTVWNRFGGVSVQQVVLCWVCVCVCVCIMWLCVEGIKYPLV